MQELEHKVHDSTERAEKAEKQVRFYHKIMTGCSQ